MDQNQTASKSWWDQELMSAGGITRKEAVVYALIISVGLFFGIATGSWVPCPNGAC